MFVVARQGVDPYRRHTQAPAVMLEEPKELSLHPLALVSLSVHGHSPAYNSNRKKSAAQGEQASKHTRLALVQGLKIAKTLPSPFGRRPENPKFF